MLEFFSKKRGEEGFTLIELMIVVLIIGILLAFAIPTFLGARTRAQKKAAQSSLRNGLTSAKVIFTDTETYTGATFGALNAAEPSITFVDAGTPSKDPKTVSVSPDSATQWTAAAFSLSGDCYYIRDNTTSGGGTSYASKSPVAAATGCMPADASTLTFSKDTTVGWV